MTFNSVYIYYRLRHNSAMYVLLCEIPGGNLRKFFRCRKRTLMSNLFVEL